MVTSVVFESSRSCRLLGGREEKKATIMLLLNFCFLVCCYRSLRCLCTDVVRLVFVHLFLLFMVVIVYSYRCLLEEREQCI